MTVTNEIAEKNPNPTVVEALFNKKFTIELPKGKLTGLQIKQHAMNRASRSSRATSCSSSRTRTTAS